MGLKASTNLPRVKPIDPWAAYSTSAIDQIIRHVGNLPDGDIEQLFDPFTSQVDLTLEPIERMSRKAVLHKMLVVAAIELQLTQRKKFEPTHVERLAQYRKIQNAAQKLKTALFFKGKEVPSWLLIGGLRAVASLEMQKRQLEEQPGGAAEVVDLAISGVLNIEQWARVLKKREDELIDGRRARKKPVGKRSRNLGDAALMNWRQRMREIWIYVFERDDFSSNSFGRFVADAGLPIGLVLSQDSERKRQGSKQFGKVREAAR